MSYSLVVGLDRGVATSSVSMLGRMTFSKLADDLDSGESGSSLKAGDGEWLSSGMVGCWNTS